MSGAVPHQASCVAIGERALLIEGAPGSGKSSLALALIDRGAVLVGDDGVLLEPRGTDLWALPPPRISGLIEVRNVGLLTFPTTSARISLVLRLDSTAPRYVEQAEKVVLESLTLPMIRLWPDSPVLALRAEQALAFHGV